MQKEDIQGFLAIEKELDSDSYVIFEYTFETSEDPIEAAATLCQETSTAQWRRPGMDEDFRPRHGAKLVELEVLERSGFSAFYERAETGKKYVRVRARIAHPHRNFGTSVPGLLTVAMGEGAFFSHGITAIKLVDIEFPEGFLSAFKGPRHGIEGLREILSVRDRPFFFGVVKPNVGLDPESFAGLTFEGLSGGLDAAKDDEMLVDPDYSPFEKRMRLVGDVVRRAEDATGEKKMFIANITHEWDRMTELADIAKKCGVNAVMVNAMAAGLSSIRMLNEKTDLPIVAHFDCIAPMSMHPWFGVASRVITKLQRMCGCDAIIMPGFGERMKTPEAEVLQNVRECARDLGDIKRSLPVPGGSDWAGSLQAMYQKIDGIDFAMVPGRGVFGHPMGSRAGAMSLRQAWDAISSGEGMLEMARRCPELNAAMGAFGM
jgi:ribulose-bisphosphate carboxylase large chain